MTARILTFAAAATAVLAAGGGGGSATSPRNGSFHTPSGNIVCAWGLDDGSHPPYVRCDIRSGLKPPASRPRGCPADSDFGQGLLLLAVPRGSQKRKGVAAVVCAGDTVLGTKGRVLRYGKTFSRGGLTCRSAFSGLTCRNAGRHGFFLARERWRVF